MKIPEGTVKSYKEIAILVGFPDSSRAVNVCVKNPLPIIIPCHTVIMSNGEHVSTEEKEVYQKNLSY